MSVPAPNSTVATQLPKRALRQIAVFGGVAGLLLSLALVAPAAHAARANGKIAWQDWSSDLFERAKRENRFIILDLEAVWCHWCHVMEETTYAADQVVDLIKARYIPVRVDQNANPDLSNRYGDWGWPATIVFAPDGTEIVKRRGYIPPALMISMLQAIIDDPSPGASVRPELEVKPAAVGALTAAQRKQLADDYWHVYDRENGGWGNVHKFIDLHSLEYALTRAQQGDRLHELMARQTLNQAMLLIDTEWGGIYQYSDQSDWRSPHYEKIILAQSSAMRVYALAHQLWGSQNEDYLGAAKAIHRYLDGRMKSPDGGYFASQDADLDRKTHGKAFYAMAAEFRDRLGRQPRIDKSRYARENGWIISSMASLYDATGDVAYLHQARNAAEWVIAERTNSAGGFNHGPNDRNGPYLGDNTAMAKAFVALYSSSGERAWLDRARATLTFVDKHLRGAKAGYISHPTEPNAVGVFKRELIVVDENVELARVATQVHWYSGDKTFQQMSKYAMRHIGSQALSDNRLFLHGVLLTDHEISTEPVHITVVGAKDDPLAQKLHTAARQYPGVFKRLEWWDRQEGPLPNADIGYPKTPRAAAFACTNQTCSLPVFEADKIAAMVDRLLRPAP